MRKGETWRISSAQKGQAGLGVEQSKALQSRALRSFFSAFDGILMAEPRPE
jgi:hypothetical protein